MKNIGIYVHIPFCKAKCFYCDFCSGIPVDEEQIEKYIDAVIKEILNMSETLSNYHIETIYFGGGTPSLIDSKYIVKIMDTLKLFSNDFKECTIEVNPESCTKGKLQAYLNAGINRLSIGLQSANNNTLMSIGRIASKENFEAAYNNAVKVGFKNISCDIMFGLPETIQCFESTIDYVLTKPKISHISAYNLELHKNTKLEFLINNNFLKLPEENIEREMKYLLDRKLREKGFVQYEISNYSIPGFESKHNLTYWLQNEYLGFGVSSASYINSTRYTNTQNMNLYTENICENKNVKEEIEELDKLDKIKEYIILRLRLMEGISILDFKKTFKEDIMNLYKEEITKLINLGLLEQKNNRISLTYKGQDLANVVWREFI